jgi:hypothetical protein
VKDDDILSEKRRKSSPRVQEKVIHVTKKPIIPKVQSDAVYQAMKAVNVAIDEEKFKMDVVQVATDERKKAEYGIREATNTLRIAINEEKVAEEALQAAINVKKRAENFLKTILEKEREEMKENM